MMFTIEYTKDGRPLNDFELDKTIQEIQQMLSYFNDPLHNPDLISYIKISTENLLYEVRACVREGKLPYDKIQFKYEDNIITITKDGRCSHYVEGFHDSFSNQLDRLF